MRPRAEYEKVAELLRAGMNDCAIARATGIPRCTVRDWRVKGQPGRYAAAFNRPACPICESGSLDRFEYAYLLGLYLGDGCLSRLRKGWILRIFQDARYKSLTAECAKAIGAVSGRRVCFCKAKGCIVIAAGWNHWPCLFPQHAPGEKHLRTIELSPWQADIAARYPGRLLRGLIHSDGCRVLNYVKGKAYPRYHFINYSDGIRRIFIDACAAYGVSWTQPKWNDVSIARARDVAKLDLVIGPKT